MIRGTIDINWWTIADFARAYAQLLSLLSSDELVRAQRLVRESDRRRYVVCRGVLRLALGLRLGATAAGLGFAVDEGGKPRLLSHQVGFNLSHSGGIAACAVAAAEVGIDVETVRPLPDPAAIVSRFCHAGERAEFRALPEGERASAFFRLWARKESCVKAWGGGLDLGLSRFQVSTGEPARLISFPDGIDDDWELLDVQGLPGPAAVCVRGRGWRLRAMRLTPRVLGLVD